MTRRHAHSCAIAAYLNLFGDNWTWLVVREAFYGASRFGEFRRNTGIARNILSDRLEKLVEAGIMKRADVGVSGTRHAYRLTKKGESLMPLMVAINQWGNEHLYGTGREPVIMCDALSDQKVDALTMRGADGTSIDPKRITARPGPGASDAARKRFAPN